MIFVVDNKLPAEAKTKLRSFGEVAGLATSGITYEAVSGHPDLFLCPKPAGLVAAPNLPADIRKKLVSSGAKIVQGSKETGKQYPETALYNALATPDYLIHNTKVTDTSVVQACKGLKPLHVNQAYTRCNLIRLGNVFITSDAGIKKSLLNYGLECHFLSPADVRLEGFPHGFLGGACGIWNNQLLLCGSLRYYSGGDKLSRLVARAGFELVELYDGPLIDGGGILVAGTEIGK
ncbi:MAG: hypothetical protein RG741_03390 [Bacteroidales bacterium]|nr:hypothetical protein [Bacteroidales bacterium]